MNNLDLSIIILSYNTADVTERCLTRVAAAKAYCEKKLKNEQASSFGSKIEVIVLDNGSKDGSLEMLYHRPGIKVIAQKENLGFARGNNIAMSSTKSPYILLLNSDAYVQEESLYKALAYFRVNLNCDVLGARLNYGSGVLQRSSGNLPNPLNIIFWILGLSLLPLINVFIPPFHPKDKNFFFKARRVGWVMGAFFMLKRQVFEKTNGFDEKFFMHMEEVEWCKRILDYGFKIWYVPFVEAVHLHGASTGFDLSSSFLNELKGIKYYLRKHYGFTYFLIKPVLIIGLILRVIAFSLSGKTKRAKVYMEGLGVI